MSAMRGSLLLQLVCLSIVSVFSYQTHTQNSVVTTTVVLPAGYVHYPTVNAAYKINRNERSWSDAKEACIAEGARLAVIDSWEKFHIIVANKRRDDVVWVGIKKKHGSWNDSANQARVMNIPWAPNNPHGFGDCVAVKSSGRGLGNKLCMWVQPFACEIPTAPNIYQSPNTIWSDSRAG